MSNTKRTMKLTLNRETLRVLTGDELDQPHGGTGILSFGCPAPQPKPAPGPAPKQQSFGFCTGPIHGPRPELTHLPAPQSFGFCQRHAPPRGLRSHIGCAGGV